MAKSICIIWAFFGRWNKVRCKGEWQQTGIPYSELFGRLSVLHVALLVLLHSIHLEQTTIQGLREGDPRAVCGIIG